MKLSENEIALFKKIIVSRDWEKKLITSTPLLYSFIFFSQRTGSNTELFDRLRILVLPTSAVLRAANYKSLPSYLLSLFEAYDLGLEYWLL